MRFYHSPCYKWANVNFEIPKISPQQVQKENRNLTLTAFPKVYLLHYLVS